MVATSKSARVEEIDLIKNFVVEPQQGLRAFSPSRNSAAVLFCLHLLPRAAAELLARGYQYYDL